MANNSKIFFVSFRNIKIFLSSILRITIFKNWYILFWIKILLLIIKVIIIKNIYYNKNYSQKCKVEVKHYNMDITRKLVPIDQRIALIQINQVQYWLHFIKNVGSGVYLFSYFLLLYGWKQLCLILDVLKSSLLNHFNLNNLLVAGINSIGLKTLLLLDWLANVWSLIFHWDQII